MVDALFVAWIEAHVRRWSAPSRPSSAEAPVPKAGGGTRDLLRRLLPAPRRRPTALRVRRRR